MTFLVYLQCIPSWNQVKGLASPNEETDSDYRNIIPILKAKCFA